MPYFVFKIFAAISKPTPLFFNLRIVSYVLLWLSSGIRLVKIMSPIIYCPQILSSLLIVKMMAMSSLNEICLIFLIVLFVLNSTEP